MRSDPEEEKIVNYLLNQLTVAEQVELEERYAADAGYFALICAMEDDLIEEYLTGALPSIQRKRFEEVYLSSPERRKRVEFARSLRETLKLHRKAESFLEPGQHEPSETSFSARKGRLVSFLLSPGIARGADEEPQVVVIGPETREVLFELDLNSPEEFGSYLATLKSVAGETICSQDGLAPFDSSSRTTVRWQLPVDALRTGEYLVGLYGVASGTPELLDNYYFRVQSRQPGV